MAEFKLSRIRYTWKGAWTAATNYNVDDVVSYGGKSYVSLVEHSASANFYTDLEYVNTEVPPVAVPKWELMLDGYNWRRDWATSRFYAVGDLVKYYGITYVCTESHISASTIQGFETDKTSYWDVYSANSQWKNTWAVDTYYKLNDIVKYGASRYQCIAEHTSQSVAADGIYPDSVNWALIGTSDLWRADWQGNTPYRLNDVVRYNGIVYRCTTRHTSLSSDFYTNVGKWQIVHSGIEYRNDWVTGTYYKLNDLVKFGGNLWQCTTAHTSSSTFEDIQWEVYAPGFEYEVEWSSATFYQPGDLVRYGGYLYASKTNNSSQTPSTNSDDWSLVLPGAKMQNEWNILSPYKVGNYVNYGGQLYSAVADSTGQRPVSGTFVNTTYWELIVPGEDWKGIWTPNTRYSIGDTITWIANAYRCLNDHESTLAGLNQPDNDVTNTYWQLYTVGDSANIMRNVGDIKTYTSGSTIELPIGPAGRLIKSVNGLPTWSTLNESENVYYVAPNGEDIDTNGTTLNAPWRTIRYACESITGPATIFVKTGLYQEVLPIIVPAGVAIAGDELRGVVIEPAGTLISSGDKVYSVRALNYIKDIVQLIVTASQINVLYTTIEQDVSGDAATSTESAIIQALIDNATAIIEFNTVISVTGSNDITVNAARLDAATQLTNNKEFIIEQTIGFIESQYPSYSFNLTSCRRDIGKFIDAFVFDITYPGNYKTVAAATYYVNATDGVANAGSDMFYVRNATGIRNVTLRGLTGELTALGVGVQETRRPTGGIYVSLDPGWGPADSRTWITTRSPYVQNVTTFGTGCVGLKIDGDLHSGGNKSIVANDFTHILSDGIGVWANKDAKTEIVSVFTYYNHIGYLAENGGKIRATNGNNSYGLFGSIAEGVNPEESPITATVNNQYYDATVDTVFCSDNGIEKLFFSNAGQSYTTATYTITGSGFGADIIQDEFRDGAVFEGRIVDPGDSSVAGGGSYLYTTNTAQDGDDTSIIIAGSDGNTEDNYLGMRVFLTKGTGAGQYGYITAYSEISKTASISRESDDTPGWDHLVPGTTIPSALDTTTIYSIEPRVTFSAPGSSVSSGAYLPTAKHWRGTAFGNNRYVAVGHEIDNGAGTAAAYSANGTVWTSTTMPSTAFWKSVTYGDGIYVAVGTDAAASSTDGITWTSRTIPSGEWTSVVFGENKFVAIASGGTKSAYSTNGTSWTATTLPEGADWSSVTYGQGKFVAVAYSDSSTTATVYSNDGVSWTAGSFAGGCSCVAYGQGKFVAFDGATLGDTVFYSTNGISWTSVTLPTSQQWTSVAYGQGRFIAVAANYGYALTSTNGIDWTTINLTGSAAWTSVTFGNPSHIGKFVLISGSDVGSFTGAVVTAGTRAQARVKVTSGRVSSIDLWEPGSGYSTTPIMTLTDPNNTSDIAVEVRIGNGVLGNPSIANKGEGYQTVSTRATLTGDGFMDSYPIGKNLVVSNLSRLPSPGDNLNIDGINDYTYKVTSVTVLEGSSAPYVANLVVIKGINRAESPAHGTGIEIREQYSQVRITGHDLLDIGLGNFEQTNYPNVLYPNGTVKSPENELLERNGGRVFYTSTNDLGDFRVGELFAVEQATGTVTLNAEFFELQGLEELRLGGVSVGGTSVVIREFSTDSTFTADSNNIIPTQRSIKAYLTRRVSGGGADAITGGVTAGLVVVGPNRITTTNLGTITVPIKVNFKNGIDGTMLAMAYFVRTN